MNPLVREDVIEEREFQTEIAGKATEGNTLVILPTATGKTIIGALAASHFLYNYAEKKFLMMAPTKPLVEQHRDTFLNVLKLRPEDVQVLTGELDPDYRLHLWNDENLRAYFATPQVVRNDCELGLDLKPFSFLIFDECHRAKKKYAYTEVAEAYVESSPYPMILGLTASPGADERTIRDVSDSLYAEHVEARTKDDPDVAPYVNEIEVERKFVKLPDSHKSVKKKLESMLKWRLERLYEAGILERNPNYAYKGDLLEAGHDIRYRMQLRQLDIEAAPLKKHMVTWSCALTVWHAQDLLESQGPYSLRRFVERSRKSGKKSHEMVISEMEKRGILEDLESLGRHPKVEAAKGAVLDKIDEDPSAKAIIFTEYRDTASHLTSELEDLGIPAARFVGQADKEGDPGLSQDEQAELLEDLRVGDLKVLVATSVGEEGLDVPSVDLVVFYEPVPSGVRYIQRKGRTGRKSEGEALILVTEETHDEAYLEVSERRRKRMKTVVEGLNSELKPLVRKGPRPERNPMPERIIAEAEEYSPEVEEESEAEILVSERTKPSDLAEERREYLESRREKEFTRREREAAKRALEKVLDSGLDGLTVEELEGDLNEEFSNEGIVKAAVDRLKDEDQVRVEGNKILSRGAARAEGQAYPDDEIHEIFVEKVRQGRAVVEVDGKWRAILAPEEYEGPRNLIKKGKRFKAVSDLYSEDGKFRVWIKDVVGK